MQTKTHFNFTNFCLPERSIFFAEAPKKQEAPPLDSEKNEKNDIAELKKALDGAEKNKQEAVDKFKSKFKEFQKDNSKSKLKNEMGNFMMKMALKMENGNGGANFGNYKEISKQNPALRKKLDETMNKIRNLLQAVDVKPADLKKEGIPTRKETNEAAGEVRKEYLAKKKVVEPEKTVVTPDKTKPTEIKPDVKQKAKAGKAPLVTEKPVVEKDEIVVNQSGATAKVTNNPEINEDIASKIPDTFSFALEIEAGFSTEEISEEAKSVLREKVFEAVYREIMGKSLPDSYEISGGLWEPMNGLDIDRENKKVSINLTDNDKKSLIGMVKRLKPTGKIESKVKPELAKENIVDSETAELKKTFEKALDGDPEAIEDIEHELKYLKQTGMRENDALASLAERISGVKENKSVFVQLVNMIDQAAKSRENLENKRVEKLKSDINGAKGMLEKFGLTADSDNGKVGIPAGYSFNGALIAKSSIPFLDATENVGVRFKMEGNDTLKIILSEKKDGQTTTEVIHELKRPKQESVEGSVIPIAEKQLGSYRKLSIKGIEYNIDANQAEAINNIRDSINRMNIDENGKVTFLDTSATNIPKALINLNYLHAYNATEIPKELVDLQYLHASFATKIPKEFTKLKVLTAYSAQEIPKEFTNLTILRTAAKVKLSDFPKLERVLVYSTNHDERIDNYAFYKGGELMDESQANEPDYSKRATKVEDVEYQIVSNQADAIDRIADKIDEIKVDNNGFVTLLRTSTTEIPKELTSLTSLYAENATEIPKELTSLTSLYAENAKEIPKDFIHLKWLSTKAEVVLSDFPSLWYVFVDPGGRTDIYDQKDTHIYKNRKLEEKK